MSNPHAGNGDTDRLKQLAQLFCRDSPSTSTSVQDTNGGMPNATASKLQQTKNYAKIYFNRKKQCFEMHCIDEAGMRKNGVFYSQHSVIPLQEECELQFGDSGVLIAFSPPPALLSSPSPLHSSPGRPNMQSSGLNGNRNVKEASWKEQAMYDIVNMQQSNKRAREEAESEDEDDEASSSSDEEEAQKVTREEKSTTYLNAAAADKNYKVTLRDPELDLQHKPYETYVEMITACLNAQPSKQHTLQGIYDWMETQYPVFKTITRDWHASVRTYICKCNRFFRVAGQYKPAIYGLRKEYYTASSKATEDKVERMQAPKKKRRIQHKQQVKQE